MVKYQNSKGECCSFQERNIKIKEAKLHSYSWQPVVCAQKYGTTVNDFKKEPVEFEIELRISGTDSKKKETAMQLYDIFEYDIESKTPGKLYFDEYYIECYAINSETVPGECFDVKKIFKVYCPYPFWIKESIYQFRPQIVIPSEPEENIPDISGEITQGKPTENNSVVRDFPFDFLKPSNLKITYPLFDFKFDLVGTYGRRTLKNESFAGANFIMIIYGFVDNPNIQIAGHPYTVYTTVYEGERLIIDSAAGTVKKIGRLGEETNLYNARRKDYSVFQKIPPGVQTVSWPGTYGIDIVLFDERSEPKWSL